MEVVIVVLLLVIVAGLVYAWTTFGPGASGRPGRAAGVRGRRRAAVAARHDPMAEAVERHSQATDPHEAAEAELRLRAQANRVAADLHAREAAALDAEAGAPGGAREPYPTHDDPGYDGERPIR